MMKKSMTSNFYLSKIAVTLEKDSPSRSLNAENGEYLRHYLQNEFHQEIVFLRAQTALNTQSVTIV